jgi:membrane dipeptidase
MYIDGLEAGVYDREVLQELVDGGLSAVTITAAFWEDAVETMQAFATWNDLARDNADLMLIVRTVADITAAQESGRVGIILGSQGPSPINDRLGFVELFHQMGLRVMQLTYNNQTSIGGSCYEDPDGGLSRFGREVVREMNRVGMIIDLSHVGEQTGFDTIRQSEMPVAITHANPRSLYDHPRNKSDELIRALGASGGILGLTTCRFFCGSYAQSGQTWADLVCRTVDLIGVDAIAIGTDLGPKTGPEELRWMRQGRWTRANKSDVAVGSTDVPAREWLASLRDFGQIEQALEGCGRFAADEIAAIMGGNWLRFYSSTFG